MNNVIYIYMQILKRIVGKFVDGQRLQNECKMTVEDRREIFMMVSIVAKILVKQYTGQV